MPGIRLVVMAQKATRRLRRTAVASSGDRCSNSSIRHVSALLKDREPMFLKGRSGGGGFEIGEIAQGGRIGRTRHHRDRVDNRRVGVLGEGADDLDGLIGI